MTKSVRVSDALYEYLKSHNLEEDTMEDTLQRLIGGPHPSEVTGIISPESADKLRENLGDKSETDRNDSAELMERSE